MNEIKHVHDGRDLAVCLIPAIRGQILHLSVEEKIVWWAGFLAGIAGTAAAEIGPEAMTVVAKAAEEAAAACLANAAKTKH